MAANPAPLRSELRFDTLSSGARIAWAESGRSVAGRHQPLSQAPAAEDAAVRVAESRRIVLESLTAIKRSGAVLVISDYAGLLAKLIER